MEQLPVLNYLACECCLLVANRLAGVFLKIYWVFPIQQSLEFTENYTKKKISSEYPFSRRKFLMMKLEKSVQAASCQ